ncbi:HNH endonuclease [Cellulophaga sp. HaHa_2_1]|uniref:HNH endonuclease n=1 Tax=Cellulophaga sp. HaHa_2_1 TaxID=2749994 RepID=UPI001C4EDB09|nr:HNH endonuclease [Cellulophaga sp. HaHa_2_1]QXP52490.1 HNH endonuclease [Cellulophaga sp. HaHa_2_1]
MRGLQRLPEPQILIDRKVTWLSNFLASGKKRPDSSKYAHNSIKIQLNSISHNKCFYCETKLKGKRKEVDHHIEVSVDKSFSFQWTNLFLSCDNCNNKIPHSTISINDALNPCANTDIEIKEHITFNDEIIEPRNNSQLDLSTIKKYRLDNELLDTRRLKSLKMFYKLIYEIKNNQVIENRNTLTTEELNTIHKFKMPNNSFSLMFDVLIEKYNL